MEDIFRYYLIMQHLLALSVKTDKENKMLEQKHVNFRQQQQEAACTGAICKVEFLSIFVTHSGFAFLSCTVF